jgi:hypothetical protein
MKKKKRSITEELKILPPPNHMSGTSAIAYEIVGQRTPQHPRQLAGEGGRMKRLWRTQSRERSESKGRLSGLLPPPEVGLFADHSGGRWRLVLDGE